VIPPDWAGFKVTRQYRGSTYQIEVERKGPGNTVRLTVNGESVAGTLVPVPATPSTVRVHAQVE
jgi:cellobiose phosphorylase